MHTHTLSGCDWMNAFCAINFHFVVLFRGRKYIYIYMFCCRCNQVRYGRSSGHMIFYPQNKSPSKYVRATITVKKRLTCLIISISCSAVVDCVHNENSILLSFRLRFFSSPSSFAQNHLSSEGTGDLCNWFDDRTTDTRHYAHTVQIRGYNTCHLRSNEYVESLRKEFEFFLGNLKKKI